MEKVILGDEWKSVSHRRHLSVDDAKQLLPGVCFFPGGPQQFEYEHRGHNWFESQLAIGSLGGRM